MNPSTASSRRIVERAFGLTSTGYRLKIIAVMLQNEAGAVLAGCSIAEPSRGG